MVVKILNGDALEMLRTLPSESVHCCVTSPPYFGLRDYGVNGQVGLEATPDEYVARLVEIFREVKRALRGDGTLWLNIGDSYAGYWGDKKALAESRPSAADGHGFSMNARPKFQDAFGGSAVKPKDLIGIPWLVAFALRADGWYLRSEIIWHKPNPMPESVTDRPTKSHEQIFLLTKNPTYYYDANAIKEPLKDASLARLGQNIEAQEGSDRVPGKTNGKMKAVKFGGNNLCPDTRLQSGKEWNPAMAGGAIGIDGRKHQDTNGNPYMTANKRSVWTVPTIGFREAHFATFPPDLIIPCVLAGCPMGGTVLDPFAGSGTTGKVAIELGRKTILIELNPEYVKLIEKRCTTTMGLPLTA